MQIEDAKSGNEVNSIFSITKYDCLSTPNLHTDNVYKGGSLSSVSKACIVKTISEFPQKKRFKTIYLVRN